MKVRVVLDALKDHALKVLLNKSNYVERQAGRERGGLETERGQAAWFFIAGCLLHVVCRQCRSDLPTHPRLLTGRWSMVDG